MYWCIRIKRDLIRRNASVVAQRHSNGLVIALPEVTLRVILSAFVMLVAFAVNAASEQFGASLHVHVHGICIMSVFSDLLSQFGTHASSSWDLNQTDN